MLALGGVRKSLGPCFALPGAVGTGMVSGVTWRVCEVLGKGLLFTFEESPNSGSGTISGGFGRSS